ncbi:MAG: AbrB/MazE/SpoVT family DNA-binding domain-containing protein [SAR202 cluster bacterium]|nr:AbrB/MazE/SpoVT family DNA-binding domain-containing protein [SAR202 cluster bacterium]
MAKVTSKGQVTIPKDVRERLGIEPGDEIEFVESDGEIKVAKHFTGSPFDKFVGYLKHLKGRTTDELIEEMRGER